MNGFEDVIKEFTDEIKATLIYHNYKNKLSVLKENEDLWNKVCDYRNKRTEFQNNTSAEELFDRYESFEKNYEYLTSNPIVKDYLDAELDLCRLVQEITQSISEAIDFE